MDYLGIFDDVAQALQFDEKGITPGGRRTSHELEGQAARGDAEVPGLSSPAWTARVQGYEGLIAAQECLPNNDDARPLRRRVQRARPICGRRSRPIRSWRSTRPTTAGCRRCTSR